MYKFRASLLAISESSDLTIELDTDMGSFNLFCVDFLKIFSENANSGAINPVQENNHAILGKVNSFIEKYKSLTVSVYQLRTYLQKLSVGEHFFIHFGPPPTREQGLPIQDKLYSLKHGTQPETFEKIYRHVFTDFLKKYSVHSFMNVKRKRKIGEDDKSKRICRFCNNNRGNVSFKNVAHAISESLGNKNIILNEECDACNWEFGAGIENELNAYLKPYAIIFGVKGKNGIPSLKGKNFTLSQNKDGILEINYFAAAGEKRSSTFSLYTNDKIALQNIYRALSKYALSVIDNSELENFRDTVEWVKGNRSVQQLPPVAVLSSYKLYRKEPAITISIRTDNDNKLPYAIGEVRYTFLAFIFIIPFSRSDVRDFTNEDDYNYYWSFVQHYSAASEEWDFRDFSDDRKKNYVFQLEVDGPSKYKIIQQP